MRLGVLRISVSVLIIVFAQFCYSAPRRLLSWAEAGKASAMAARGDVVGATRYIVECTGSVEITNPNKLSLEVFAIPGVARCVREQHPNYRPTNPKIAEILGVGPVAEETRAQQAEEVRLRMQDLRNLGGSPDMLAVFANGIGDWEQKPQYEAALSRANAEIARLRQEAEQRRQQEEARTKQEAEKRRQEEEARAKREAELRRRREEVRAQQAEEVRLRMQELEDLGGDTSILKEFENGSGDPEKIREYKAALNRADAEIVRLRKEGNLNNQSAIDQLTEELESQKEENQELRGMIEQLMKRIENLEMGKK